MSSRRSPGAFTALVAGGVAAVLAIIVLGVYLLNSLGSTDGGHVAVVRNGGPLDNSAIRQVLPANSGVTNIGFASDMHNYPTSQRFFTISSKGNGDSDESVSVPTSDGIQVGIEGTAYFIINTSPANSYKILKRFDNDYGTRSFKCTKVDSDGTVESDGSRAVWDGDKGFSCFLDQIFSPIINNDLRQSIGNVSCADLVASCSLVQNSSSTVARVDPTKIGTGNSNLARIETDISNSLTDDLNNTLHGSYFENVHFNLSKVDLPQPVQDAITKAQSSFAQVTQAQAAQKRAVIESQTRLKQARLEAQANAARQRGYDNCATCRQIDTLKALPGGLTTLVTDGNGVSLSVPAGAK